MITSKTPPEHELPFQSISVSPEVRKLIELSTRRLNQRRAKRGGSRSRSARQIAHASNNQSTSARSRVTRTLLFRCSQHGINVVTMAMNTLGHDAWDAVLAAARLVGTTGAESDDVIISVLIELLERAIR